MITQFFSIGQKSINNLCEVLDESLRPLCLMRLEEIRNQKLPHKSVAVCPVDNLGRFLLSWSGGNGFGFSFFGAIPAGADSQEYALAMLRFDWGAGQLRALGTAGPRAENYHSYTTIYEARISAAMAQNFASDTDRHLLADEIGIRTLAEAGGIISPLFASVFAEGLLRRSQMSQN